MPADRIIPGLSTVSLRRCPAAVRAGAGRAAGRSKAQLVFCRRCPLCLISLLLQGCGSGKPAVNHGKEVAREWRNGRRAGFRCQCPKGRGGSNPPSRTQFELKEPRSSDRGSFCFNFPNSFRKAAPARLPSHRRRSFCPLMAACEGFWGPYGDKTLWGAGGGSPPTRGYWREARSRRRELARWLRMAAAAEASSPSAMAAEMDRCSWTTWSKWSRA